MILAFCNHSAATEEAAIEKGRSALRSRLSAHFRIYRRPDGRYEYVSTLNRVLPDSYTLVSYFEWNPAAETWEKLF